MFETAGLFGDGDLPDVDRNEGVVASEKKCEFALNRDRRGGSDDGGCIIVLGNSETSFLWNRVDAGVMAAGMTSGTRVNSGVFPKRLCARRWWTPCGWGFMINKMNIRSETPADFPTIRNILKAAFANEPHSRQTEHLIVEELRKAGAMTIGLVAEEDGIVVGHIAFSPAMINGIECGWSLLGPVAVEPSRQKRGIGGALIREGLRQLRALGTKGCALVGHPTYYGRFGFAPAESLGMEGVPPEVFFALQMNGDVPRGAVTAHPAFFTGL
jgi:putative acetyltransferase